MSISIYFVVLSIRYSQQHNLIYNQIGKPSNTMKRLFDMNPINYYQAIENMFPKLASDKFTQLLDRWRRRRRVPCFRLISITLNTFGDKIEDKLQTLSGYSLDSIHFCDLFPKHFPPQGIHTCTTIFLFWFWLL